jgi:hypothetical protein
MERTWTLVTIGKAIGNKRKTYHLSIFLLVLIKQSLSARVTVNDINPVALTRRAGTT